MLWNALLALRPILSGDKEKPQAHDLWRLEQP